MSNITIEEISATIPPPLPIPEPEVETLGSKVWGHVWPVLLAVVTPILWVVRGALLLDGILITAYKLAYIRIFLDRKISTRQKCPACGIRQEHKITYVNGYQAVVHKCARCDAEFGGPPIEPPSKWAPIKKDDGYGADPLAQPVAPGRIDKG